MFRLTWEEGSDVLVEKYQNDYQAIVPIAYCSETNRLVSVDSKFYFIQDWEIQVESGLIMEFTFEISVLSLDGTRENFSTQDRNLVRNILDENISNKILSIVLSSITSLVKAANPDRIYRVTKSMNLPSKALRKHDLVTEAFQRLGYEIATCERDEFSRDYWIMERVDEFRD